MVNSRAKGARVERELSNKLKEWGYNARRGQQYCGANGDEDVISTFPFYIECKAVENLNVHKALAKCKEDNVKGEKPECVIHKKNRTKFLFTCDLEDFLKFMDDLIKGEI